MSEEEREKTEGERIVKPTKPEAPSERPAEFVPAEAQAEAVEASPSGTGDQQAEAAEAVVDESKPDEKKGGRKKPGMKRRRRRKDAFEATLQGRRELCHRIKDIAARMLKMVMTRVASSHLKSTKGLTENELRGELIRAMPQIADKERIKRAMRTLDPERHRRTLRGIIIFDVLLQQERYALVSRELQDEVLKYEREIVKESKVCKFLDPKEMEKSRLAAYETYNVVLDAAWRHEDKISIDEANLLSELRRRLGITLREHRLLEARMARFPKRKCALHLADEIEDAKRQLQKEGILWTFRDEDGKNIDAVPYEIMEVIRSEIARVELQRTNYERLLNNKAWSNADFQQVLRSHGLQSSGSKAERTARIVASRLTPSQLLATAGVSKLQTLCREVGLVSHGSKAEIISRLIGFYDNLTFEPVLERDERGQWYAAYELLASRKYSELKAQGLIEKQEDVERAFEKATDFLFENRLKLIIEKKLPVKSADGKIYLRDQRQVVLWDCKSDEREVNLKDHLESQFDGYMRTERGRGYQILYFLVIAPRFTKGSLVVAQKYKMATNWDVALIKASALKRMAEKWHDAKPEQAFPLTLLNLTDLVDDDRADDLLSLVL